MPFKKFKSNSFHLKLFFSKINILKEINVALIILYMLYLAHDDGQKKNVPAARRIGPCGSGS